VGDHGTCTVIVPTYNRSELMRRTLDSLVAQDLLGDRFEVIVVDDGSSDGTAAMVEGYHDRLRLSYFFQDDEVWGRPRTQCRHPARGG
jgi:glycosyltransferase involved in cell wall biosynthesis